MNSLNSAACIVHRRGEGITGTYRVPGDKSITHRALFFAALWRGRTTIANPSPADDCRRTLLLLRALGYYIEERADSWLLDGAGRSTHPIRLTLDCGNSGTTARLAAGFLTGERGEFLLVGDASLSRRPMNRVVDPLRRIGGIISATDGVLPVAVIAEGEEKRREEAALERDKREEPSGENFPRGGNSRGEGAVKEELEETEEGKEPSEGIAVASAQVHAALVLAAARSVHGVHLRRTKPMRDHTLRMAAMFGIEIERRGDDEFVHPMAVIQESAGQGERVVSVPGDFSSAAFLVAAALLVPGSDLTVEAVGLNPTRISFLEAVQAMGGDVEWSIANAQESAAGNCEPFGTIRARYSPALRGIRAGSAIGTESSAAELSVALMMDELPLLALVASQAEGETVVAGAAELRVKESDRIAATVALLGSLGIAVQERPDGFRVVGPQPVKGGNTVDHHGDHRLAMLAGVAGLIAEGPVTVPEPEVAAVSWPDFWQLAFFD